MTDFARELMKKIGFDESEQAFFSGCAIKYEDNPFYQELKQKINEDALGNADYIEESLKKLAAETGDHIFALKAVFVLEAAELLLPKYLAMGNSEELFYRNMSDIKVKLNECKQVRGIYGVSTPLCWWASFFQPTLFWLGRLQFEISKFKLDSYEKNGISLKKDDMVIAVHIPSGEPMKEDDCLKAYDLACDYFKDLYEKQGCLIFTCHSWLLFDDHDKFLNPESNIVKFKHQYEILETTYENVFGNGWRVFGSGNIEKDPTKLPDHTSLLKAYKKWLCDGNKAGYSYGIRIHKKGDR